MIVDPIEEGEKVKAEISFILYKDHIQYLQKQQHWWVETRTHRHTPHSQHRFVECNQVYRGYSLTSSRPEGFREEPPEPDNTNKQQEREGEKDEDEEEEGSDSEDDESDLFVNTNRCNYQYIESEEEDDSEEGNDEIGERTENGS